MATARSADDIQREIERARAELAATVDQLAERTNPKRLADQAKTAALAKARTPAGKAAIGAAGALVLFTVIRRRRRRQH